MLDCDYVKNIARENIGTEVFVLIFLEHDPYFFARYIHSWENEGTSSYNNFSFLHRLHPINPAS